MQFLETPSGGKLPVRKIKRGKLVDKGTGSLVYESEIFLAGKPKPILAVEKQFVAQENVYTRIEAARAAENHFRSASKLLEANRKHGLGLPIVPFWLLRRPRGSPTLVLGRLKNNRHLLPDNLIAERESLQAVLQAIDLKKDGLDGKISELQQRIEREQINTADHPAVRALAKLFELSDSLGGNSSSTLESLEQKKAELEQRLSVPAHKNLLRQIDRHIDAAEKAGIKIGRDAFFAHEPKPGVFRAVIGDFGFLEDENEFALGRLAKRGKK